MKDFLFKFINKMSMNVSFDLYKGDLVKATIQFS